jgi:hypothetical protein
MHATAVGDEPRVDGSELLEVAAASTKEIATSMSANSVGVSFTGGGVSASHAL